MSGTCSGAAAAGRETDAGAAAVAVLVRSTEAGGASGSSWLTIGEKGASSDVWLTTAATADGADRAGSPRLVLKLGPVFAHADATAGGMALADVDGLGASMGTTGASGFEAGTEACAGAG
jgi:hypothetical protein